MQTILFRRVKSLPVFVRRIGEENPPFSVATLTAMYEEYLAQKRSNTADSEMSDSNSCSPSDSEDTHTCFSLSNCTQVFQTA